MADCHLDVPEAAAIRIGSDTGSERDGSAYAVRRTVRSSQN